MRTVVVEEGTLDESLERIREELEKLLSEERIKRKRSEELSIQALKASNCILSHMNIQRLVRLMFKKLNHSYAVDVDLPFGKGSEQGKYFDITIISSGFLLIVEFRIRDVYGFFSNIPAVYREIEDAVNRALDNYIESSDIGEDAFWTLEHVVNSYTGRARVVLGALLPGAS